MAAFFLEQLHGLHDVTLCRVALLSDTLCMLCRVGVADISICIITLAIFAIP